MTIELSREGVVEQCRGFANAYPSRAEFAIVKDWARDAGLGIGPHVAVAE